MLYSMTGYGKAICSLQHQEFQIELKTLNAKQLDIFQKNNAILKDIDIEIKKILAKEIIRGRVEWTLSVTNNKNYQTFNYNSLEQIYRDLEQFSIEKNIPLGDVFPTILKMYDNLKIEDHSLSENDMDNFFSALKNAIHQLQDFRKVEGEALENDIVQRINNITNLLANIATYESDRITNIRKKINAELLQLNLSIDQDRLEQELIFYVEKLDITEEKIRLQAHCNYFLEIVNDNTIEKGKKLGFIAQEIGREINTIGSKANEINIQKNVVMMKDELEKIKEQLNNVL